MNLRGIKHILERSMHYAGRRRLAAIPVLSGLVLLMVPIMLSALPASSQGADQKTVQIANRLTGAAQTGPATSQRKAPALMDRIQMAPHLAVYDLTLKSKTKKSGIVDVTGRMVFEFTGSRCAGYSLNMRLVTRVLDDKGQASVSDQRTATWERGDGRQFSFNTTQYLNDQLTETLFGKALKQQNARHLQVELTTPASRHLTLAGNVMFPTQHSLAILKAASTGTRLLHATIFDGSETGDKSYRTATFIGKPLPPATGHDDLPPVANAEHLAGMNSWPVMVSYYDESITGFDAIDGIPVYQLGYRLYANGVSRELFFDYGDFAIEGRLSKLVFLKTDPCPGQRRPAR